jgi:hypothetical protein
MINPFDSPIFVYAALLAYALGAAWGLGLWR